MRLIKNRLPQNLKNAAGTADCCYRKALRSLAINCRGVVGGLRWGEGVGVGKGRVGDGEKVRVWGVVGER